MTDNDNDSRPRIDEAEIKRQQLNLIIGQLIHLRDQTNPRNGEQTATDKDWRAFMALKLAGELVNALAGWAINHQVGLAFEGLEFVPRQPLGTTNHPQYLQAREAVDAHRHEIEGARRRQDLDPATARRLLLNLLDPNPGAFPNSLRKMLLDALDALEFGEVQPLLNPRRLSRNIGHAERQLQLEAVGFVHYRKALGTTKYKAVEAVATAFGVSSETIRTWERRLRSELGSLGMDQTIWHANNAAELHRDHEQRIKQGEIIDFRDYWDDQYGDLSLQQAAEMYRTVRREDSTNA